LENTPARQVSRASSITLAFSCRPASSTSLLVICRQAERHAGCTSGAVVKAAAGEELLLLLLLRVTLLALQLLLRLLSGARVQTVADCITSCLKLLLGAPWHPSCRGAATGFKRTATARTASRPASHLHVGSMKVEVWKLFTKAVRTGGFGRQRGRVGIVLACCCVSRSTRGGCEKAGSCMTWAMGCKGRANEAIYCPCYFCSGLCGFWGFQTCGSPCREAATRVRRRPQTPSSLLVHCQARHSSHGSTGPPDICHGIRCQLLLWAVGLQVMLKAALPRGHSTGGDGLLFLC
jgi:hypothetical protein